ncbi:hypothetical protein GcM1_204033 [Golovinomyces cichoracearum]|uniref:Uncharacterized protein n=1 Tax=Golovinomyces cichoracearum TaxID=62708 RepID=A0A420IXG7_9PEZI|nr:hypothetical protein GcM1_204033 [Golovinomyces cichoracearum]
MTDSKTLSHSKYNEFGAIQYRSGAKATNFQTPRKSSSASTSSSLQFSRSAASIMSISSYGDKLTRDQTTRKRNLSEFNDNSKSWGDENINENGWMPKSPKPLVNMRHEFERRIEVSSPAVTRFDDINEYENTSYRKRLEDLNMPRSQPEIFESTHMLGCALLKGQSVQFTECRPRNWTQFALQAVNVVAGKAWEFCKNSAAIFKGFQAGGGTAYKFQYSEDSELYFEPIAQSNLDKKEKLAHAEQTPVSEQCSRNYHNYSSKTSEYSPSGQVSPRPSKRFQISSNKNNSLERNWVVVPTTASTPTRPRQGPGKSSLPTRSVQKCSHAQTRSIQKPTVSRSIFAPSTPIKDHGSRALRSPTSHAGSPTLSCTHRASFASPRSPRSYIPLSITSRCSSARERRSEFKCEDLLSSGSKNHAQSLAMLLKNGEKKQDESLKRLDLRMKEMIREGKKALNSKIEFCMDNDKDLETSATHYKRWKY